MTSANSEAHTFFKGEISVVKNALDVAEAVMSEAGAEALSEVKKRFSKQGSEDSKSSSASGGGEKPHTVFSSPPTATLDKLEHCLKVKDIVDSITTRVSKKTDATELRKEVTLMLGPFQDLIAAMKKRSCPQTLASQSGASKRNWR